MAIRPSHHEDRGFTLIEMVVILAIVGIVSAFALPSLVSFNKPLRDGTNQFVSQLALIRSKAISSGKAYRIRPAYLNRTDYTGGKYPGVPRNFIVEYAGSCQVNTYGPGLAAGATVDTTTYANGTPDGWQAASQLNLDLPESVGIDNTAVPTGVSGNPPLSRITINGSQTSAITWIVNGVSSITPDVAQSVNFNRADRSTTTSTSIDPIFNWSICYDNRGMYYASRLDRQPVSSTTIGILFKNYQGNNQSINSLVTVSGIGQLAITTYNKVGVTIAPSTTGNPVY